ncbi:DnaJ domain-containing protein [Leptotrichia hofstadii]|uniref:DnaJ domain-containing protein n=1 Tax=Leptotrichia hofstadii TaxID=157688 RepID=UPI00041F5179|nr:DnaJ domain-containing protein [Leptotrichia hofstadii]
MTDYYKILDVLEDADAKEIKVKYRKLAMKYHPDRNPDDKKAEEMFKAISEAYEILGDENKRKEYDEKRKNKGNAGSQRFGEKKSSRAEQNSESAKRGAEAFFRNFSAIPIVLRTFFEVVFVLIILGVFVRVKLGDLKKVLDQVFEIFFRLKRIS